MSMYICLFKYSHIKSLLIDDKHIGIEIMLLKSIFMYVRLKWMKVVKNKTCTCSRTG